MTNKTKILGVIFSLAVAFGMYEYPHYVSAVTSLHNNPDYIAAGKIENIKEELGKAYDNLLVTRSNNTNVITYPNTTEARVLIESASNKLKSYRDIKGREELAKKLEETSSALPLATNLSKLNGKIVDNSTFEKQREIVSDAYDNMQYQERSHSYNVPKELRTERNIELTKFLGAIAVGLTSFGLFSYDLCAGKKPRSQTPKQNSNNSAQKTTTIIGGT